MGYAFSDGGFTAVLVATELETPVGAVYFSDWPTPAQLETAFPGYQLNTAKQAAIGLLQNKRLELQLKPFSANVTGQTYQWDGFRESEHLLAKHALEASLDGGTPGWSAYYYKQLYPGVFEPVTLTAEQTLDLFRACQQKHRTLDATYNARLASIAAITDTTQTGIDAVAAIVW